MNHLLIFVLVLFAGGHIYSYTQVQRLDGALATAEAEIAALSQELDGAAGRLDERINTNATDVDALRVSNEQNTADIDAIRASNEESAAAFKQRLDGLEADIREDVSRQLTNRLVQAATSEAIERAVLENLPRSEPFLTALGGVLAEQFHSELQGVPGEQVDPAVLASLLARNDTFLDAMRFELLAEIAAGE